MRLCYSILMSMALIMLLNSAFLLGGCGQKGALYLPPDPAAIEAEKKKKSAKQPDQQPQSQ